MDIIKKDNIKTLSPLTLYLHWLVAFFILSLLGVGIYMTNFEDYSLIPIHKSIGILLTFVILTRVFWRILNGWLEPVYDNQHTKIERALSRAVHWVLILSTLLMPFSGMLMSTMSGNGLSVFGFALFPNNPDPSNLNQMLPINKMLAGIGHNIHHWLPYIFIPAIVLHIIGAIKHHVIDKDSTLKRMVGR